MAVTLILALSLFGLGVAFFYSSSVRKIPIDMGVTDKDTKQRLARIHAAISTGAMAFLKQEYKFMAIFMVVFAAIIAVLIDDHHTDYVNEGLYTAIAFIFGAVISIASGFIGMKIATEGNVRTTVSANKSLAEAFKIALHSGSVMGFGLVSLAVLGMLSIYLLLKGLMPAQLPTHILMEVIAGFGLGGLLLLYLLVSAAAFSPRRRMSGRIWSEKLRPGFPRTIRATLRSLPTTLAITWGMLPGWEQTYSARALKVPVPPW